MIKRGVIHLRSDYINDDEFETLCRYLPKKIELICRLMDRTGLRITDCLQLRTEQLRTARPSVYEQKTGKHKRIFLNRPLYNLLLEEGVGYYIFTGTDKTKHLTRQAVYLALKTATQKSGIKKHITPHTFRKRYAVRCYKRYGLYRTMKILNHDNLSTTLLYALSDKLTNEKSLGI